MRLIRLGTRASALALWQTRHVAALLAAASPDIRIDVITIATTGDRVTDVPLSDVEGTGFFTTAIEHALAAGDIDVAIHSYKDLPIVATPGLVVAAVPTRGPVEDVLCARDGRTVSTLPAGSRVGTCSTRRTAQMLALRPDLNVVPLRGNVPTRVRRVTAGELDAIVLARAGLVRLGLESHVTEVFPAESMLPAPAQGALAVQCRADDTTLVRTLSRLDDGPTRRAVEAERTVLHALGGGCSAPVGAVARCEGTDIVLTAGVFALDGSRALRVKTQGTDPHALGQAAARHLVDKGAASLVSIARGGLDRPLAPAVLR